MVQWSSPFIILYANIISLPPGQAAGHAGALGFDPHQELDEDGRVETNLRTWTWTWTWTWTNRARRAWTTQNPIRGFRTPSGLFNTIQEVELFDILTFHSNNPDWNNHAIFVIASSRAYDAPFSMTFSSSHNTDIRRHPFSKAQLRSSVSKPRLTCQTCSNRPWAVNEYDPIPTTN